MLNSLKVVHQQCFAFIQVYPPNVGAYTFGVENVHVVTKNSPFHILLTFDDNDIAIRDCQNFGNVFLKVQLVYFGESREISYHDVALSYTTKNCRMDTECHVEASISALSSENGKKLFALRFVPFNLSNGVEIEGIQPIISNPILVISKKKVLESKTYSECIISYSDASTNTTSNPAKRRRLSLEKFSSSENPRESCQLPINEPSCIDEMVFSLQNLTNTFIQACEKVDTDELISQTLCSLSATQKEILFNIFSSISSNAPKIQPPATKEMIDNSVLLEDLVLPSENEILSSIPPNNPQSPITLTPLSPLSCSFNSFLKSSWGYSSLLES